MAVHTLEHYRRAGRLSGLAHTSKLYATEHDHREAVERRLAKESESYRRIARLEFGLGFKEVASHVNR